MLFTEKIDVNSHFCCSNFWIVIESRALYTRKITQTIYYPQFIMYWPTFKTLYVMLPFCSDLHFYYRFPFGLKLVEVNGDWIVTLTRNIIKCSYEFASDHKITACIVIIFAVRAMGGEAGFPQPPGSRACLYLKTTTQVIKYWKRQ